MATSATNQSAQEQAQEKREQIRAAYDRRVTAARRAMNDAIHGAEAIRDQTIKQADGIFRGAIARAEEDFADEMTSAVRERTALMTKLIAES